MNKEVLVVVVVAVFCSAVMELGIIIIELIEKYLKRPEATLKQSLTRIKWLLGGILIALIMLLRK